MSTLLVIDAGNSRIKYAKVVDGKVVDDWRHDLNVTEELCQTIIEAVDAPVAMSSVVPSVTEKIEHVCARLNRPLFHVTVESQTLIRGMPSEMGADRVAAAYAAYCHYAKCKRPVLLMTLGTATTLMAITAEGQTKGGMGLIYPGLTSTLEVLHERCELLPMLKMEEYGGHLGITTESQMRNGVFLGHLGVVTQFLKTGAEDLVTMSGGKQGGARSTPREKKARQRPLKVATGGWSEALQTFARPFDVVDPMLTLMGVYLIAKAAGFGETKAAD